MRADMAVIERNGETKQSGYLKQYHALLQHDDFVPQAAGGNRAVRRDRHNRRRVVAMITEMANNEDTQGGSPWV